MQPWSIIAFEQPVVLILGGQDKGSDWFWLADRIRTRVKSLVVVGEKQDRILDAMAPAVPTKTAADMAAAVLAARQTAVSGDVVLLAPGCASFDRYASYADRGDDFIREIQRMRKRDDRE